MAKISKAFNNILSLLKQANLSSPEIEQLAIETGFQKRKQRAVDMSSYTALLFDACIYCGFIYGTYFDSNKGVMDIEPDKGLEIFSHIIKNHGCKTLEEVRVMYENVETCKDIDDFYPSLFQYEGNTAKELKNRVVNLSKI